MFTKHFPKFPRKYNRIGEEEKKINYNNMLVEMSTFDRKIAEKFCDLKNYRWNWRFILEAYNHFLRKCKNPE